MQDWLEKSLDHLKPMAIPIFIAVICSFIMAIKKENTWGAILRRGLVGVVAAYVVGCLAYSGGIKDFHRYSAIMAIAASFGVEVMDVMINKLLEKIKKIDKN